ncbi:hypothetical protein [Burkholderia sp. MSHR3999]|uniref:hypothetical protein n=1 Tax=Burkholderia sp. MSHR3999 TaxID=1542965 RepID=UPI0012E09318|nr:hypothetical protein [Burkholderia sp. MSHR3999]
MVRATHASPAIANANQPIICSAGVDLSAERSEDGAGGRYTALLGGAARQIHCSNHSGVVTGADTFARSTLMTMAREALRHSSAFLLVTFLWQDKEK